MAKSLKFNSHKMKKSIISEAQIVKAITKYEGGRDHGQICHELGIYK
jgi:hypothetical protein